MVVIAGDRILRVKDVMAKTSFGRTKIYSLLAQRRFPQPHKLDKATIWLESQIDAWIAEQFPNID